MLSPCGQRRQADFWCQFKAFQQHGTLPQHLIAFLNQSEIRREAADSALARQGEATTYQIDLEAESNLVQN
jgi:hypothetical protein